MKTNDPVNKLIKNILKNYIGSDHKHTSPPTKMDFIQKKITPGVTWIESWLLKSKFWSQ